MLKKITSSIAGASIVLAVVNLLTKGVGFLRDMYIAGSFGLSEELDVYLVGAVIPISITPIFLYIGQNYLIPQFDKIKLIEDKKEKVKIISIDFFVFLFISLSASIILYIFSEPIIRVYLNTSSAQIQKAVNIFKILLITFPLSSLSAFYLSYLQAKFEYRFTAVSFLILNSSMLISLLILNSFYGIYSIPVSFTLGTLFQMLYLLLRSKGLGKISIKPLFKFSNFSTLSKATITNIIIIESISQLFLISDRYFYKQVATGGLASLSYGLNLITLPVSIISVALSTALFPKMTYNFNRNNILELEKNIVDGVNINLFLMIPISVVFFNYGDVIVAFLFQRGKFTAGNTLMTFEIIKYLAVSIIFFSVYTIFNKLLYSAGKTTAILFITLAAIGIKILSNIILVKYYTQNGLALAYTISYFTFFILSYFAIVKTVELKIGLVIIKRLAGYLFLGTFLAIMLNFLNSYFSLPGLLLLVFFVIAYFGILFLFNDDNYDYIKNFLLSLRKKEKIENN